MPELVVDDFDGHAELGYLELICCLLGKGFEVRLESLDLVERSNGWPRSILRPNQRPQLLGH